MRGAAVAGRSICGAVAVAACNCNCNCYSSLAELIAREKVFRGLDFDSTFLWICATSNAAGGPPNYNGPRLTQQGSQGFHERSGHARGYSATVAVPGPPHVGWRLSWNRISRPPPRIASCSEQIRAAWSIHGIMELHIHAMVLLT
jgi:hypothetical protein